MAINNPKAGPNSVPAYQLSGLPYLTGSTGGAEALTRKQFDFPYVTRFITLSNHGSDGDELKLAVSNEGLAGTPSTGQKNYFSIDGGQVATLDIRCKTVFISSDSIQWSMCAGMTPILADQFPILTGSNGFYGVGGAVT